MTSTSPRITARVDTETQHLLSKASVLSGMSSINSFVLSAAIEKAKAILDQEQTLKLNQQDAMLLVNALDNPSQVHERLKQASERYSNKTQA
jgi:uncharacterized protein (DUF1778 family)